ncbi:MAG: hypothetical protein AB8B73_15100 [Ekhidna sp.]
MQKVILMIGMVLVASIAFAQGEGKKDKPEIKIEEYKERLELSDNQVSDLKEMREKYRPQLREIRSDKSKDKADKMRAAADVMDLQQEELATILSESQFAELQIIREEAKRKKKKAKGKKG